VQAKTKQVSAVNYKLEKIKTENPGLALAAAKLTVGKLKAARVQAAVYRAREALASKKREQEKFLALAAEKQEELKKTTEELRNVTDSTTKSKLKVALKTATSDAKAADAAAKKCAAEMASEQSNLDKLSAEYQRVKTANASLSTTEQSKL
jgi:hypothetical protein